MEALIVPLGNRCLTPLILQALGWRNQSLPFDWCCSNLKQIATTLSDDLVNLVTAEDLLAATYQEDCKHYYAHNRHGMIFPHLLNPTLPVDKQVPEVLTNLNRRCQRLLGILKGTAPVVFFIYYERAANINYIELLELAGLVKLKYPQLRFRLLAFDDQDSPTEVIREYPEVVLYRGKCPVPPTGQVVKGDPTWLLLRQYFTRAFVELKASEPQQTVSVSKENDHDNKQATKK